MSLFLKHAEEIFETAQEGGEEGEFAILVGGDGSIHVLPASGWQLEPLRLSYGAKAAYRVTRERSGVRVEARSGEESYVFEGRGRRPAGVCGWRPALPEMPRYWIDRGQS